MSYALNSRFRLPHQHLGVQLMADNGKRGDKYVSLNAAIAHDTHDYWAVLYLSTNGDPSIVAIAELDCTRQPFLAYHWGELDWELQPETRDWIGNESCEWFRAELKRLGVPIEAEQESNAHLIDAAPELLEALESFVNEIPACNCGGNRGGELWCKRCYFKYAIERAQKALAKARGEA